MIRQERPTVMGLQEAQPHQITYLAKNCPDYAWYGLGRDTGAIPPETESYAAEECMAVFTLRPKSNCSTRGPSGSPRLPTSPPKAGMPPITGHARGDFFEHKASGKRFYHLNTHLDHQGATAREESIKLIASKIKQSNTESYPVFLTADFNSDTTDNIFAPLFPHHARCAQNGIRHGQRSHV